MNPILNAAEAVKEGVPVDDKAPGPVLLDEAGTVDAHGFSDYVFLSIGDRVCVYVHAGVMTLEQFQKAKT